MTSSKKCEGCGRTHEDLKNVGIMFRSGWCSNCRSTVSAFDRYVGRDPGALDRYYGTDPGALDRYYGTDPGALDRYYGKK